MKLSAIFIFIIVLVSLLSGCAASTDLTPDPLKCRSEIIDTPDGRRLLVQCNQDVQNPPNVCEVEGDGNYLCNVYHADDAFCNTFPGVCAVPQT